MRSELIFSFDLIFPEWDGGCIAQRKNTDWLLDQHHLSLKASVQRAMVRESDSKSLFVALTQIYVLIWISNFDAPYTETHPTPQTHLPVCVRICYVLFLCVTRWICISLYPSSPLSVCCRRPVPRDHPCRVQCPLLARRPPPNQSSQRSRSRRSGRPLNCLTQMGLDSLMSRSSK